MHTFNTLALYDVSRGHRDLLERRGEALARVDGDGRWRGIVGQQLAAIGALPETLTGTPMADELGEADDAYDQIGGALYELASSMLRQTPWVNEQSSAAAAFLRGELVPSLAILRRPFAAEAEHTLRLAPRVEAERAMLEAVPTWDGRNLYAWASDWIAVGRTIDALLRERGDLTAQARDRRTATEIRGQAIRFLNDLRRDLGHALERDPALPADLDAQVFGFYDVLQREARERIEARRRARAARGSGEGEPQAG